jgi:spore maturation protein CgeB
MKRRLHIGRENKITQQNLLELTAIEKPIWIHFRLPIEFNRNTILKLKKKNILLTQYFNDDPFSRKSPFGLHWKFRNALTAYDAHFVYRAHNVHSYLKVGAKFVEHCPPAYDPARHFIDEHEVRDKFIADLAFIGHWENDGRIEYLDTLHRLGFNIILKGANWDRVIRNRSINVLAPITTSFGKEYNYIYSNVLAGVCFFSKINNDTWTERALEIIAVGGLLVCERTIESETYFVDRVEACYFSSIKELIEILTELKNNPFKRENIRNAGHRRLMKGNYSIKDRAKQINEFIKP